MFINTSLVTAMLRGESSRRWDVLLGEMQAIMLFYPCTGKEGQE